MQNSKSDTNVYECPFLDQCEFIQNNIDKMPELIQRTKERYCTQPESECARRWLYVECGGRAVPPLMLPEQTAWARQIMEETEHVHQHELKSEKKVTTIQ
jgi:predicted nucleotide-binding protein (sugar kinase/HSP70/actin superfamily)